MESKNNKRLSNGSYSILIIVIAIAAAIIVNMMIGKLSSELTQFDFSTAKLYTLTDTTKNYLKELDEAITVYYICESGQEDDTTEKLLERYADASAYVTVEQIDPVLYPGFTSQYTEDRIENNSVIVVSDKISKIIKADEMYITEYSSQTNGYVKAGFDGEGQITSAIDYVTTDEIPVFYQLIGNGEMPLGDSYVSAITKNNIELRALNLLTEDEIPQDAKALIMNTPAKDYSEKQAELILEYLEKGGRAIIFTTYTTLEMPRFHSILKNYGVDSMDGIILEGNSNSYMTYQYCLIPEINYTAITAKLYGNTYLLLPMAQGIQELEVHRNSISYQPLLVTSGQSYAKADVQNMTTSEKEPQDQEGPFALGMLIQEDINQDKVYDTEILYYSTSYLLDEDYNLNVSGSNSELIGESAAYLKNGGEDSVSAIPPKTLQVPYLTMTSFTANFWTVVTVFVLPAVFLLMGVIIWFKRRRK